MNKKTLIEHLKLKDSETHTFIIASDTYTVKTYKHLSAKELIKLKEDILRALIDPNFIIKTNFQFEFIK